jgi:hypothetical protein
MAAGCHAFAVLADGGSMRRITRERLLTTPMRITPMFKRPRNLLALCVIGSTLTGANALAGGPHGGESHHHGSYHQGGRYHEDVHHSGWYGPRYHARYYYPPATTYVPVVTRYLVPPEYAGTPAGYLITYGGANYMTNGDGTMSPR